PSTFGSGNGSLGTIDFNDVDGLSFDPITGTLYGTVRRSGNDLLIQIDPATGAHVPDAFGPGVDYVRIQKVAGLPDVDDIAVDPVTGTMYASVNNGGSSDNHLVIVDKTNGNVTDIGIIKDAGGNNIQDIEGLAFFNDGNLYGSSGKNGPTTNALYRIDKATAVATLIGQFTDPLRDFEGLGCLTANASIVVEKSTNGQDADDPPGPTIGAGQPVTWTYFVRNTGNITLINVQVTDDKLPAQNPICTISNLGPGQSNLDVGVTCQATGIAAVGQYTNTATVSGESISSGQVVTDTDPSHYNGIDMHTAAIGNFVWHDLHHSQTHEVDGIQDGGEPGLADVLVELYDSSHTLVMTDTTDASGFYHFDNLLPGTYTVKIADSNFAAGGTLEGWYASPPNQGSDDTLDSDGDRNTHEATVTVGLNETNDNTDFGFFRTGVSLQKTGTTAVTLGNSITYTFTVENTGDVVLHGGVSVYDPLINPAGDHEIWNHIVWPGEVYQFTRTYTPSANQCGDLTNTATAVGHPLYPDGSSLPDVTDQASWTVTVNCLQPDLTLDKSFKPAGHLTTLIVGDTVSFDVVITNTGNTTFVYLPLDDYFDKQCLTYTAKSSVPQENQHNNASGTIQWLDLTFSNGQDLAPGQAFTTTINFDVTGASANGFNTAAVNGALDEFGNGISDLADTVNFVCADASIEITPDVAVNQVGSSHTFTVTVRQNLGSGWVPVQGVHPSVSISPTPGSVSDGCASAGTDANGQCTVVINSNSVGTFTAHASVDFDINGAPVHRETDGNGQNSGDATKVYVDARLTLTPPQAANQIGQDHVFTATLEFDYGSGFIPAPAGETITFSLNGVGSIPGSCTTNSSGQCTVTLTSGDTGLSNVTASWQGTITTAQGSISATAGDSAVKHWVDARLSLEPPSAVNEVNDTHVFTATLEFDYGSGFVPAPAGETITFSLSGVGSLGAGSCTTDTNGRCTVTLDSSATGQSSVTASWNGQISTNEGLADAGASDSADKTWVDASIRIDPQTATNNVGESHTFTVTVQADDGTGGGMAPVQGVHPSVSINPTPGSVSDGCASAGTDANGQCTVVINHTTAGQFSADASVTLNVAGLSVTRSTAGNSGPGGSGPATKTYVSSSLGDLVWEDLNADGIQDGNENGIPGVTVALYDNGTCAGSALSITTTDNNGSYLFDNLPAGTYSVHFTLPSGYHFSPANQGGDDTTDSDPNTTSGCAGPITLPANTSDLTWDAGQYCLNPILGTVFEDLNGDQQQG
ncbi:MAG: hypothetical protein D6775_01570, partial [Caldilineae bacterium]